MKKSSKKGMLLFIGAMAACAFVVPSMASAASWGPVGSHHVLDSPNFGFTSTTAAGNVTTNCTRSSFTAKVASAQNLEITSATFGGHCTWSGPIIGTCIATPAATKLPWTATATTTNNIQIHGVHIDLFLENPPASSNCGLLAGLSLTLTGTVSGGNWTGNAAHAFDFDNAEGLELHSDLGTSKVTLRGLITDTQNSLDVT